MIRRFFSYYRPYKGLFILDFTCAVIAALLELSFPLAVNQVVDKLLPAGNWVWISWACLGLLAIYLLNTGLHAIVNYWGHQLGLNIETDMRKELFDHLQKQSFYFYDNRKSGTLLSRITTELLDIGEMAHHGPEDIFIAAITLIGAFAAMFMINPNLALIILLVIVPLICLAMFFNKKMTAAIQQMYSAIAEFVARLTDSLGGIRVIQAFANEGYEKEQFAGHNQKFYKAKMGAYKIITISHSANYMLMRLLTVIALVCGSWFVLHDGLTAGQFIAFILLTNVIIGPIQKINTIIESYPKGIAGFKRFTEIIDIAPDIQDSPDAIEVDSVEGLITYKDVTFGYDNQDHVLSNINLTINAGETIAFVGPSGAGKTTLCSLLPRFYEIESGSITIDGIDIRQMQLSSLRKQIGIVQQDVFLFSSTFRNNIAYGNLDATEEQIWEAARQAKLDEFIRSQPEGLDTLIGERGVKLSGGQKQRMAIARMFLKNPPILILDEATSALDTETEMAIQQSLAELSQGRTTLVIAHRLATIKNADRIVVVTEDGIAEQGSHQQLLAAKGNYYRLHQAQFGS